MDTDDLPPTQKGRHNEIRGSGLREFAGLKSVLEPLDPFALAKYAKLLVVDFEKIRDLSGKTVEHLLVSGKDNWSGGAASIPLPSGEKLIILNPTHPPTRHRATLMEEISHVFLGHKPSKLAVKRKDKHGNVVARDYNADIEEEAYGTGAAALLPYAGIKHMIGEGKTVAQIARHYQVSRALVEYRMKISRLWAAYSENLFDPK